MDWMKSPKARAQSYHPMAFKATSVNESEYSFEQNELDSLPPIHEFSVPRKVMVRRQGRSFEDIEETFRVNKISSNITDAFKEFGEDEKWAEDLTFSAAEHQPKLRQEMPAVADKLTQFMEKAQYELKVPKFKPAAFGKEDEQEYSKYMQKECPGIIKHDRDLIRYFLLTKVWWIVVFCSNWCHDHTLPTFSGDVFEKIVFSE